MKKYLIVVSGMEGLNIEVPVALTNTPPEETYYGAEVIEITPEITEREIRSHSAMVGEVIRGILREMGVTTSLSREATMKRASDECEDRIKLAGTISGRLFFLYYVKDNVAKTEPLGLLPTKEEESLIEEFEKVGGKDLIMETCSVGQKELKRQLNLPMNKVFSSFWDIPSEGVGNDEIAELSFSMETIACWEDVKKKALELGFTQEDEYTLSGILHIPQIKEGYINTEMYVTIELLK